MNIINDLGILGLASRLERLSAVLKHDSSLIYKQYHGSHIKYKWYPVIYVLYRVKETTVLELAKELSYAHPSIIQTIEEMAEEKLVKSANDKTDGRRRLLSLTSRGKEFAEKILPFSKAFEKALLELTKTQNNLLKAIEEVEQALENESFFKRVNRMIKK